MKPLERADKRWGSRYDKAMAALESARSELKELAELNYDHPDATWSNYAKDAEGCLEGAKYLLLQANDVVMEKRLGEWPCKHNLYPEKK